MALRSMRFPIFVVSEYSIPGLPGTVSASTPGTNLSGHEGVWDIVGCIRRAADSWAALVAPMTHSPPQSSAPRGPPAQLFGGGLADVDDRLDAVRPARTESSHGGA